MNYKNYLLSIFFKKGNSLATLKLFLTFFNLFSRYIGYSYGLVFLQNLSLLGQLSSKTIIPFLDHTISFFSRTKFIFFFFFEKLNKQLYKYAKYKKPRYSIKYTYTPPYRRFRNLLNFFKKSSIYFSENTFNARFAKLLFMFFTAKNQLFFYNYTNKLQAHVFKKKLIMTK